MLYIVAWELGPVSSGGHFGPQTVSQFVQEVKSVEIVISCHTERGGATRLEGVAGG